MVDSMEVEFEQLGEVARVTWVSADQYEFYIEFRNGKTARLSYGEPANFRTGQVVIVDVDRSNVVAAPQELWPEESWVGIVRLRLEDRTLIDASGRYRLIPTSSQINYKQGNTVECKDSIGVVRILSDEPIKLLDLSSGRLDAESFIIQPSADPETFDSFAGFDDIVDRAKELIELPLKEREALSKIRAEGIKGVLFTGLPGTGKTMLARIIAHHSGATFYWVSGPEISSKWYGESEEIIRNIFHHATKGERAIIFFDEIDSVAPNRSDAHEATRKVVGQLLSSMSGFTRDSNVVVIATTNRPQDIDPALRRPGRFDWEIEFRLPNRKDREAILERTSQNVTTEGPLSHQFIANRTDQWSAADLSAIWSEAALLAVADGRAAINDDDYFGGFRRVATQRRKRVRSTDNAGEKS